MYRLITVALLSCLTTSSSLAAEVPLSVEEPSGVDRQQWPVTSGIPLAAGALRDERAAALFDSAGRELPLQTETLVRWRDGSVRWLLLDFQIDLKAKERKALRLRYGPEVRRAEVPNPLKITKRADGAIVVEPGPVRLEYGSKHDVPYFFPQGAAWLTGTAGDRKTERRLTFNCGVDTISLLKEEVSYYVPFLETIAIEQAGPIRACIRFSESHDRTGKERMFRYIARVHAWRGRPYVRVFYTIINDRQDQLMSKFQKLSIEFDVLPGGEVSLLDGRRVDEESRLFQVDENHYLVDDKPAGRRASGWAASGSEDGGLAVGLREFWQNWPKALSVGDGPIVLELFPELPKGLYDGKPLEEENKLYYALRGGQYTLKVGVAKTHEFWIRYLDAKPDARQLGAFFQATEDPLLAVADPAYACATKALGDFPPSPPALLRSVGWDQRASGDARPTILDFPPVNQQPSPLPLFQKARGNSDSNTPAMTPGSAVRWMPTSHGARRTASMECSTTAIGSANAR